MATRSQIVYRIPGTAARTLRVTLKNINMVTATISALFDCILPQSDTPLLVVLVRPLHVLAATHDKPDLLTYPRTVPDTVKAEFGSHVIVVDPSPGWNTATMLNDDLQHLNENGQQHVTDAITAGIKAEMMRRLTASVFGQLTRPRAGQGRDEAWRSGEMLPPAGTYRYLLIPVNAKPTPPVGMFVPSARP